MLAVKDTRFTLWAYATMGRLPGERVLGALEARAVGLGLLCFTIDQHSQLYQYLLSCSLDEGCHQHDKGSYWSDRGSLRQLREEFESVCQQAFAAAAGSPSERQLQVSSALCDCLGLCVGLCVEDECRCPRPCHYRHARQGRTAVGSEHGHVGEQ